MEICGYAGEAHKAAAHIPCPEEWLFEGETRGRFSHMRTRIFKVVNVPYEVVRFVKSVPGCPGIHMPKSA